MKKFIMLALLVVLSVPMHAQEQTDKKHTVSVFLCGNSGTLANDTTGIMSGNGAELGLVYKYSINPYFQLYTSGVLMGSIVVNNNNVNSKDVYNPEFELNGIQSVGTGVNYIEFGMSFGQYGYIAMRGDTQIKAYGFAPINMGSNQKLTFLAGIEAYPFFLGKKYPIAGNTDVVSQAISGSIKALVAGVNYTVNFTPNWAFGTEVQYRTDGTSDGNETGANTWETDSLDALKYNSSVRWDNTVYYNPAENTSFWLQVRYLGRYLVENESIRRQGNEMHDIYIRFGFTQAFDF